MANALWMILYRLDPARADTYLRWFHEQHIPEKLARPGYSWAAHYRVPTGRETAEPTCIALFGGDDSRVFYDPSPAQIKPRQTPETRDMMSCRRDSRMLILAREWSAGGASADTAIGTGQIQLALFDANGNDEQLGAWLAQDFLPAHAAGVTHKYLASSGSPRHLLIHEPADASAEPLLERAWNDWSEQVAGYLSYPAGEPLLAQRIWPVAE